MSVDKALAYFATHPDTVPSAALIAFASVFKRRSSRLHQPQLIASSSGAHRVCISPSPAAPAAPAARHQPPVLAVPYGAGLWSAGCRQSWPAAGRPQDRLGGCWWPPQPRGCIPDGTVAK